MSASSSQLSPTTRAFALFTLIVLCIILCARLRARADQVRDEHRPDELYLSYLPSKQASDVMSMGYRTFAADLLWIQLLPIFAHQNRKNIRLEQLTNHLDILLHLDPEFAAAYRWAGLAPMLIVRPRTPETVEASNEYLLMGMEKYPDDPYFPFTVGMNYALSVPQDDPETRRVFIDKAVSYLERVIGEKDVSNGAAMMISNLLSERDNDNSRAEFLENAYLNTQDPELRRALASELAELDDDRLRLSIERRRLQREFLHKENYPYLDPGLFFQVGTRLSFDPNLVDHRSSSP